MAMVKQYHADTDTTYVYSSEYYWDPEKKQSRSKRRLIGKIDPDTGEIIPTGKKTGRPRRSAAEDPEQDPPLQGSIPGSDQEDSRKDKTIRELKLALDQKDEQIRTLERQNSQYAAQLSKIRRQLAACIELMDNIK